MAREFKFRKKRNTPKAKRRQVWVERSSDGDALPSEMQESLKRVTEDLMDGRISEEEAAERLNAEFAELVEEPTGYCAICEQPTENLYDIVCETCAREETFEHTYTIHIEEWEED